MRRKELATMSVTKEQLLSTLEAYGQQEVLRFWNRLDDGQRQALAQQVLAVDLAQIHDLFEQAQGQEQPWADLAAQAESPPSVTTEELKDPARRREAREIGEQALAQGQIGMVLVAGGQGTRLGFDQPKGMYPIGPLSGRTLFQMVTDVLKARARYYGTTIPLYLMTSPATDQATREHIAEQGNFGLHDDDLRIFQQGTMPAVDDRTGQLLLGAPDQLFLSPDGHGGMLPAFQRSGCLQHANQRGLKTLFYCQIDNPLAQICDPVLIGLHLQHQSQATTQVIRKTEPMQRVGNVVAVDGRVQIIEYSDLPQELAELRLPDGSLRFWAGSIAVHVFQLDFLSQVVSAGAPAKQLPFHIAHKKVPYLDQHGQWIETKSENAYKFERFIFDLLPLARSALVVEVDAREGFAAVKNAEPAPNETPTTTRAAIVAQHRRWLEAAGVSVAPDVQVEIHPGVAHDAETVAQHFQGHPPVTSDQYFEPEM